jgi:colanic acid biosynthesis glycosyl transferase WcaI
MIHGFAQSCERAVRAGFSHFSTISLSMVARLEQKGIKPSRITFFPNWVDIDSVHPMEGPNAFRAQLNIPDDRIVLLYSGNMGAKQGLEILPHLADRLRDQKRLHFVFCGDGAFRARLAQAVADLDNVSFLPLQPLERLNELLNAADIHLLPQRADAADLVMPSKLTGMLASGRPVIATAVPGTQVARAVQGHGVIVRPGDVEALAQAVLSLSADPSLRRALGKAARDFAVQELARDSVLLRFEAAMEEMLGSPAKPAVRVTAEGTSVAVNRDV